MFDCAVIWGLLLSSTAWAASSDSHRYDVQQRATVQDDTDAFVQSLKLAPSQAQDLMIQAKSGPPGFKQVRLACLASRYALGSNSVESNPANNLVLEDANWSVVSAVLNSTIFIIVIQVSSVLGITVLHYNSSIDSGGVQGPQDSQVFRNKVLSPQWRPLSESWLV